MSDLNLHTNDEPTIGEITRKVEESSTTFEKTNTDLKRKYLIWCIDIFKKIAERVPGSRGCFGTGYPFYALDRNLNGILPIIPEQIRYNRQLVLDGEPYQDGVWKCASCLIKNYKKMPDLKTICKPCPNVPDIVKPRKLINRLPDLDMWIVVEDGKVEESQEIVSFLLAEHNIRTSDINPILTIDDIYTISRMLKSGLMPEIYLPIDTHIIEYSKLKKLIENVPDILLNAKKEGVQPYIPIHPKSYRKKWQYDDEAYNYIYDFLSAFTSFDFEPQLQQALNNSRGRVARENSQEELLHFLMESATEANFRRFQTPELEDYFIRRIESWREIQVENPRTHRSYAEFVL